MLNIISHRGHVDQNHNEITLGCLESKKRTRTSAGKTVEKIETSVCHCWECKTAQELGKRAWQLLKKLNIKLPL